jgi:hypothetical protein
LDPTATWQVVYILVALRALLKIEMTKRVSLGYDLAEIEKSVKSDDTVLSYVDIFLTTS